jgi:hypothetical protein
VTRRGSRKYCGVRSGERQEMSVNKMSVVLDAMWQVLLPGAGDGDGKSCIGANKC